MKRWLILVLALVLVNGVYALDCSSSSDCPDDNDDCTLDPICLNETCSYTTIPVSDDNPLTYDYCSEGDVFHESIVGEFGTDVSGVDPRANSSRGDTDRTSADDSDGEIADLLDSENEIEDGEMDTGWIIFFVILGLLIIGAGSWLGLKYFKSKGKKQAPKKAAPVPVKNRAMPPRSMSAKNAVRR